MTGKEKNTEAKARIAVSGKVVKPYVAGPLADGPRATSNKMKSFAKASNFREAVKAARTPKPALDLKPFERNSPFTTSTEKAIKRQLRRTKSRQLKIAKFAKLAKAA